MLYLHRSERADLLVAALGDVLSRPLDDPMVSEVVSVPARGVERWLSQQLSHRLGGAPSRSDGVCANIEFPFPGVLVSRATAVACGCDPDDDRWAPPRLVWPLMDIIDANLDDPVLAPLAEHLRASSPPGPGGEVRRYGAARRLADLYDRYSVHRPAMVLSWLDRPGHGGGRPGEAWQSALWAMLRAYMAVPSPAERLQAAPARLREEPDLVGLPARISLFGLTRAPASHLEVLRAIAVHRDVHLFLLHPSGALWDKVALAVGKRPLATPRRQDDPTERAPRNPLLRSWARDAREMQLVLVGGGDEAVTVPSAAGTYRAVADAPSTLLGRVQSDIRGDRAPPGVPRNGEVDDRLLLSADDDSLRAYACHGRARQVEVAREAVLHLLAADPTLEPRHVIVMCPDVELFAPLVQATFGTVRAGSSPLGPDVAPPGLGLQGHGPGPGAGGGPEVRARLADRSVRQTNPLLAVAAQLLDMAGGRVTAAQVLDLASREPVARRFGFDEDELSLVEGWLAATGARWGIDAPHRRPWKLDSLAEGTWEAALDRLSLGVAMSGQDRQVYAGLLPFGDVGGSEVQLVGRLCELVDRLARGLDRLSGRQSVGAWVAALAQSTDELAQGASGEAWQAEQLRRTLKEVAQGPGPGAPGPLLDLAEARSVLAERLQGRPTRANFRTGDLTICTLVPMRSVPHRVVCLVGLDDGVFPRQGTQDGDDLLQPEPHIGDRDVRSEDRQLLLDAVLAATEHLIITFQGRDQHLNQRRPPAVTVSELLDVVDQTARAPEPGKVARDYVVVEHPLQPFDPRNFSPGRLGLAQPWSYDAANLEGARALVGERQPRGPFLLQRLPPLPSATVPLASLTRFLEYPVKAFLRERLGYYATDLPDRLSDALPVELGPLEKWALGDRLLDAYLTDGDLDAAIAAELGRGLLPPGPLAGPFLREVVAVISALAEQVNALPGAQVPARPLEVNVVLPSGTSVVGSVPGWRDGTVVRCTYSKARAKHRLRAWAHFLVASASYPQLGPSAVTVSQSEGSKPARPRVSVRWLPALEGDVDARRTLAMEHLQLLVDLYQRGMREPLPLYCNTSAAWAQARSEGDDPNEAARGRWASDVEERPGEADEPEHLLVLGGKADFSRLLDEAAGPGDPARGRAADEASRFGRLAVALWQPVLAHEHLSEH